MLSEERAALQRYEQMVFIRLFEDKVDALYRQGQVRGPAHLGQGQEAIAVGVGSVLQPGDYSIGTYRGHAHALARGTPAGAVLRELLGRSGGICGGKGGSMHITSLEHGYMGSYAIVGAHLPIACGLAWASKIKGTDQVTACFFGDGTTNIGAFHEAINLAAIWGLPVVFVCENNSYMEYTPISQVTSVPQPAADRAPAYGLPSVTVDGNDVDAVREVVGHAMETARGGGGPTLVEATTYRHGGHSAADPADYRSETEVASWKERDPLLRARAALAADGVSEEDLEVVTARASAETQQIATAALEAPALDVESALVGMWSDGSAQWRN
ncbi:MAG: pyruvate dehydrogenase (acetyl-transferring) E1 component subunit alpha [Pseudonocardiaceae bacterium]|nr:pyruvate dehydrogenase (acetyl-transferring) E1 component subunit alpha [Pseudonocardiaceae bacterium]